MSTTVEVLRAARNLYARAPSHASRDDSPAPGTVCVYMATEQGAYSVGVEDGGVAADQALRRVVDRDLMTWNAESSTETVLAGFDAAIAAEAMA